MDIILVMRFENYHQSKYRGMYIAINRWCNQFHLYTRMSFREYCVGRQKQKKDRDGLRHMKYMMEFEERISWVLKNILI